MRFYRLNRILNFILIKLSITSSLGEDYFKITFSYENVLNENLVRTHSEVLDRQDGTYIVRYRMHDNYENLMISVKNKNDQHVAKSPYYLRGKFFGEYCECPETDINKWYQIMQCNESYNQIELDMMRFKGISFDMNEIHDYIYTKFNQKYSNTSSYYRGRINFIQALYV